MFNQVPFTEASVWSNTTDESGTEPPLLFIGNRTDGVRGGIVSIFVSFEAEHGVVLVHERALDKSTIMELANADTMRRLADFLIKVVEKHFTYEQATNLPTGGKKAKLLTNKG